MIRLILPLSLDVLVFRPWDLDLRGRKMHRGEGRFVVSPRAWFDSVGVLRKCLQFPSRLHWLGGNRDLGKVSVAVFPVLCKSRVPVARPLSLRFPP